MRSELTFGGKLHHWSFGDLASAIGTDDEVLAVFQRVRDEIEGKVESWLAEQGYLSAAT
jgi:hypothetical protein